MTRDEIKAKMIANNDKIKRLHDENIELRRQSYLISDDKQQFIEIVEELSRRENRKKVLVETLIGRIKWKETFYDEDTGKPFEVERTKVVRLNGKWVD